MHPVRIGCSGWQYDDWRGVVYPPGTAKARWLGAYAERFDTVEVNSTFYRLASKPAVARWVEDTPAGFLFTIKASRYLTHMKRLKDLGSGIGRFYERIEPLVEAKRLGPVVWQLPESFQRDDDLLTDALDQLPPGRHCFEFRHPSWFAPDVEAILEEHHIALVIADHPERTFQTHALTADWTLVRFHCGARGHRGNYSPTELETWARRIAQWRRRVEVLAYFNNDWEGFAPGNALSLARRLNAP